MDTGTYDRSDGVADIHCKTNPGSETPNEPLTLVEAPAVQPALKVAQKTRKRVVRKSEWKSVRRSHEYNHGKRYLLNGVDPEIPIPLSIHR